MIKNQMQPQNLSAGDLQEMMNLRNNNLQLQQRVEFLQERERELVQNLIKQRG